MLISSSKLCHLHQCISSFQELFPELSPKEQISLYINKSFVDNRENFPKLLPEEKFIQSSALRRYIASSIKSFLKLSFREEELLRLISKKMSTFSENRNVSLSHSSILEIGFPTLSTKTLRLDSTYDLEINENVMYCPWFEYIEVHDNGRVDFRCLTIVHVFIFLIKYFPLSPLKDEAKYIDLCISQVDDCIKNDLYNMLLIYLTLEES